MLDILQLSNRLWETRLHSFWGVSPRSSAKVSIEPAKRVVAAALNIRQNDSAAARCAGFERSY